MLAADEAERVARHIEYCPLCRQEMQAIQDTLAEFEPFPAYLSDAPFIRSLDIEESL
jgi:anti-sigma factor RsiW